MTDGFLYIYGIDLGILYSVFSIFAGILDTTFPGRFEDWLNLFIDQLFNYLIYITAAVRVLIWLIFQHFILPPSGVDPHWITGFSDRSSCFGIVVSLRQSSGKWEIRPEFVILTSIKHLAVLERIQAFFGGIGKIYTVRF